MTIKHRIKSLLARYRREDKGSVVVMTALFSPLFIGGLGLGVETGHWYQKQRQLQLIADLSANAAAARLRAGDSQTAIDAAAQAIAESSGLSMEIGTFEMNTPPVTGSLTGDGDAVEVTVSETRRRWFTAMFGPDTITLTARAVTKIEEGTDTCVLALSDFADAAILVSGSTNVHLTNCVVSTNSVSSYAFKMNGNSAAMTSPCVYSVGGAIPTSNLTLTSCSSVKTQAPKTRDPYRDLPEPAVTGSCNPSNIGHPQQQTAISPDSTHSSGMNSKRFCGGLTVKGAVSFEPGLYIIDGGTFRMNGNASISAPNGGVTFYLANDAELSLNGNGTVSLAAPQTGTYAGVLFFGPRSTYGTSVAEHLINGSAGMELTGAIYLPSQNLTFSGNSNTQDGCTQIVANTVTMTGNSDLVTQGCEELGGKSIETNEPLALVE